MPPARVIGPPRRAQRGRAPRTAGTPGRPRRTWGRPTGGHGAGHPQAPPIGSDGLDLEQVLEMGRPRHLETRPLLGRSQHPGLPAPSSPAATRARGHRVRDAAGPRALTTGRRLGPRVCQGSPITAVPVLSLWPGRSSVAPDVLASPRARRSRPVGRPQGHHPGVHERPPNPCDLDRDVASGARAGPSPGSRPPPAGTRPAAGRARGRPLRAPRRPSGRGGVDACDRPWPDCPR